MTDSVKARRFSKPVSASCSARCTYVAMACVMPQMMSGTEMFGHQISHNAEAAVARSAFAANRSTAIVEAAARTTPLSISKRGL